jgi:hypothetical protein
MKIKQIVLFLFLIATFSLQSCSDDDYDYEKLENKENKVALKVYSNTPDVPVYVYCWVESPFIIKNYWEGEFVTKAYQLAFDISCKEPTVLLTGEIYVNGKLRSRNEGNGYVGVGVTLK